MTITPDIDTGLASLDIDTDVIVSIVDVEWDIETEIVAQFNKWGVQDHPSFCPDSDRFFGRVNGAHMDGRHGRIRSRNEYYGIPSAHIARRLCDLRHRDGRGTYADIALEEVCEAFEADNDEDLVAELVQCAGVFAQWAACVKRRMGAVVDVDGLPVEQVAA